MLGRVSGDVSHMKSGRCWAGLAVMCFSHEVWEMLGRVSGDVSHMKSGRCWAGLAVMFLT